MATLLMVMAVLFSFVIVVVWGALEVPTAVAAKVKLAGVRLTTGMPPVPVKRWWENLKKQ